MKIDLNVKHLALPDRVNPGATVYVVWVRGKTMGDQEQNLGALRVDKNLNGRISAVTPLQVFDLFITAEPTQMATTPTGKTLLSTTVAIK